MKRRVLSIWLVMAIVLSLLPVAVFAADVEGNTSLSSIEVANGTGSDAGKVILTVETSSTFTADDAIYYGIFTAAQWTAVSETWAAGYDGIGDDELIAKGSYGASSNEANKTYSIDITDKVTGQTGTLFIACYDATAQGTDSRVIEREFVNGKVKEALALDAIDGLTGLKVGTAITNVNVSGKASGGTAPYTFSSADIATAVPGLTISAAGVISGTPTTVNASTGSFTVTVTDAASATQTQTVTVSAVAQGDATLTNGPAGDAVTMAYGDTSKSVAYTVSPADFDGGNVTYTVADSTVISVGTNGAITTNKVGSTTVTVSAAAGTNYAAPASKTVTVTVNKADQAAPELTPTDADAAGAATGTIAIKNPVSDTAYEYKLAADADYTPVTLDGGKIVDLPAGTYNVRLKETDTHNAGAVANATIGEPGAPKATITDLAKTYTGKPQKATVVVKIDGVEQDAADYEVVYKDKDGNTVADPTNAGNYTVTVTMNGKTAGTETLVIAQAKPGEPELADEIIVDETTLGDVMKNGALKLPGVNNDEVAGTFTWVGDVDDDTMIVPGTKYQWKFDTTNPNYQGLTGEIAWELVNDEHAAYMFGTNAAKTIFEPNRGMTRAEVAVMIANLEEYDKDEDYEAELTKVPQDLKAEKANLEKWTDNGYNKICYILSEGIMQGRQDGNFDPYGTITRQEMAIVLGKYLGIAKYEGTNLFNDLEKPAVYAEGKAYINALKDAKKIDGFPDGGYHPTENLTRAQAAKMMNYAMDRAPDIAKMKAANVKTGFVDVQKFVGITDADWAVYNIIEASVTHAVSEYH